MALEHGMLQQQHCDWVILPEWSSELTQVCEQMYTKNRIDDWTL